MKKVIYTVFTMLVLLMTAFPQTGFSQVNEEDIKAKLPELLGASNVGKEFWFTIPPCFEDESFGFANFIKIFVTSPVKTPVTVEVPGKGYFRQRETVANDVIEFNITPVVGQPYTKGGRDPEIPEQVFRAAGIHVYADYPLVVYCVVRYHWTSDGFLCYPSSSLGREYIVAGHPVDAMFVAIWNYKLPNTCGIVAAYDDTKVVFTLGGNTLTKTAGGMRPGQTKTVEMDKGDVWMFSTQGSEGELTGSKIIASRPVCVTTGNQCDNIPTGNQWCDYTAEMDVPTFTWGLDLHVGKIPNRKFASIIKVFAKEPNTKWYRDGRDMGMIPEGGGMEGRGYQTLRMTQDMKPGSVVISGNKPINVVLYNPGVQEDGYPHPNSDPFVMATTPVQQYQKEILFCTPGIMGGQGFNENYVNVVYEADSRGMMPDDMEFGRVVGGQWSWKKLNTAFPGVDELFKKDVNNKKYGLKLIVLPGDGVYRIRANTPFAAYSFGYSDYDSYGFPTSAALADLERPDTVPPWPKWTQKCDGTVDDGKVTDMPDEDSVRSNLSMIVFQSNLSYNYEFNYNDFIPGETRTTSWKLTVIDVTQDAKAVITFTDRRGNDSTITIEYHATKIAIRPKNIDYGLFKVGQTAVRDFWVINESSQSPVTITRLNLKTDVEFKLSGINLPLTINPKDSVKFQVTFTAVPGSIFTDSIGVGDTCIFAYKARVKAAIENPYIYVTDIDFGKVTVGLNKTMDFQLTNKGNVPLVVSGYSGPNLTVYTHNIGTIDNGANKMTVQPGEVKVYQVTFQPTAEITYPDTIWFQNDAPNNGTEEKNYCLIIGQGIAPGLTANDYDWGRKRIDHPRIPRQPYTPNDQVILLSNPKTQDVYISDYQILNSVNGDAFEFDSSVIRSGLTIKPGGFVYIPVKFHPTKVGYYEFVMKYINDANLNVTTTLKGIGIMPKLQTQDYNFGTTIVKGTVGPTNRNNVIIRNLSYMQDTIMVGDTVLITNLLEMPTGAISNDGTTYGQEGFMYNINSLNLPVRLAPGESLTIPAEFQAQHIGAATANITTASDAEAEVTSNWTGDGIDQKIRSFGATADICYSGIQDAVTLTCYIENYGSGPIQITKLSLDPPTADLRFKSNDQQVDNTSFTLPGPSKDSVKIIFQPINKNTQKTFNLLIDNNSQTRPQDTAVISVKSKHYDITTTTEFNIPNNQVLNKITNVMEYRKWDIREEIPGSINLTFSSLPGLTDANIQEIKIKIDWEHQFIGVKKSSISVGSAIPGWTVSSVTPDISLINQSFTVVLKGTTPILNSGELLKFNLTTYLPTSKDLGDITKLWSTIELNPSAPPHNKCVDVENSSATNSLAIKGTCTYSLRKNLIIQGQRNALNDIAPNPVGAEGALISFSVGLDGWTSISIYNSMGELVSMPLAMAMKPGEYEFNLPVNDMTSGKYYIIMNCGDFTQTKELIISK